MKTTDRTAPQPELNDEDQGLPEPSEQPSEQPPEPERMANPWRPMTEAPTDRIIEGRFANEEVGEPIIWRASRRRAGHRWIDSGVWHSATIRGSVEVRPVEWREWFAPELRFEPPEDSEAA